jgi:hypothetical protein
MERCDLFKISLSHLQYLLLLRHREIKNKNIGTKTVPSHHTRINTFIFIEI